MRRTAALSTLLAAVLPLPASSLAAEKVATPPPEQVATPAPGPAPPGGQPAAQAQLTLALERIGGRRATVLVGQPVRVRGSTGAFAPGETFTVRFFGAGRKVGAKRVTLRPGARGGGAFVLSYRPDRSGTLLVRAAHAATPALGEVAATSRTVDVLPRSVGPHARKRAVRALQRRLARLGYVVGERGSYDARTGRAVLAFRKVTGMARSTDASESVMSAIARGGGHFKIRRPDHGRHIEADLSRQVIALVEQGEVGRIYPISSGAPSTPTVRGSFRVYAKTPGTNAKGMVDSAYFARGYATHGYDSVPVYPASHGCLRVPIADAPSLFDWIKLGTPVDVYR